MRGGLTASDGFVVASPDRSHPWEFGCGCTRNDATSIRLRVRSRWLRNRPGGTNHETSAWNHIYGPSDFRMEGLLVHLGLDCIWDGSWIHFADGPSMSNLTGTILMLIGTAVLAFVLYALVTWWR